MKRIFVARIASMTILGFLSIFAVIAMQQESSSTRCGAQSSDPSFVLKNAPGTGANDALNFGAEQSDKVFSTSESDTYSQIGSVQPGTQFQREEKKTAVPLNVSIDPLRKRMLEKRLYSLQREIKQADEEITSIKQRIKIAEGRLERDRELHVQGFVSVAQVQTREEELLEQRIRLSSIIRSVESLQRERISVESEKVVDQSPTVK